LAFDYSQSDLGHVAPTLFVISVQLNLDQELNWVNAELRCTNLNLDQPIPFSLMVVVIPWMTLIGQGALDAQPVGQLQW